jgi:hypothetical protein
MFAQVIKAKVSDPADVRAALDTWMEELASGATGWLGSTTGVTDDGTMVAVVRFDSEENARRNAERPEHKQWWDDATSAFAGEVTIDNSVDVDDYVEGDPDSAGFVQVMQGRVSDVKRAWALSRQRPDNMRELRPDILATLTMSHDDGRWSSVAYFTSEADARQGESKEPPPEMLEAMKELASISIGDITYYDLRQVWLRSPQSARQGSMASSS